MLTMAIISSGTYCLFNFLLTSAVFSRFIHMIQNITWNTEKFNYTLFFNIFHGLVIKEAKRKQHINFGNDSHNYYTA